MNWPKIEIFTKLKSISIAQSTKIVFLLQSEVGKCHVLNQLFRLGGSQKNPKLCQN